MKRILQTLLLPLFVIAMASCDNFAASILGSLGSQGTTSTASEASSASSAASTGSDVNSSVVVDSTVAEILDILYGAGYQDIARTNDQETWTFRTGKYLSDYGLTVEVVGFYQGYIPVYTRWMMMDVFATEEDAGEVFWALVADSSVTNYLHIDGPVVLQTGSEETWDLFN
jgi:hypothetical protein